MNPTTLLRSPSVPAFVGAGAVWLIAALIARHGFLTTLVVGASVATFLVVVGVGQMFVVTGGNGGIDLSIPAVMTLSAFVSCEVMAGRNELLLLGVGAALLTGLSAAAANATLIELVGLPPLVATLAVGFVIQSAILVLSSSASGLSSPALGSFVAGHWGPVPIFAGFGIVVTLASAVLLRRTSYGRRVEAVGQNATAARLAGLRPHWIRASTYLISGLTSALGGLLLAAYTGGASLDLGTPYQLASIAVVVLGGSLIVGGRSSPSGVWAASLLLTLLVTLINVAHISTGMQNLVEGALIILVLCFASSPSKA